MLSKSPTSDFTRARSPSSEVAGLTRRTAAEGIGTAFLLIAVVGSGIMAERLMDGIAGLVLLANSVATGTALVALIIAFGPISGAHLNPVVTLSFAIRRSFPWREAGFYLMAHFAGALAGVAVATFGLVAVIWTAKPRGPLLVAPIVGCYITSAYWFTSSTSFANPAVTLARAATNTFSGIHPGNVAGFALAQCLGAVAATAVIAWLTESPRHP